MTYIELKAPLNSNQPVILHFYMLVRFRFLFCVYLGFIFYVFCHVSLGHFVLVLLAFVVLCLVFSILSQEIAVIQHLSEIDVIFFLFLIFSFYNYLSSRINTH